VNEYRTLPPSGVNDVKEIVRGVVIAMACVVFLENKSWSQQEKKVVTTLGRDQAIFKEWAASVRMSTDVSKAKPKSKRAAYLNQAVQVKENKLMAKYHSSQYQFFVILKQGVAEKWPTEKPTDMNIVKPIIAERQANLDAIMFEKDMEEWVEANTPVRSGVILSGGASAAVSYYQSGANSSNDMEMRRRAPTHTCGDNVNGLKCQRKVVGEPGRLCYEHRD
jgi:hypothetical protein